jgi:hypothetical protein
MRESIEHFVWQTVTRTASHDIPSFNIQRFRNFNGVLASLRSLRIDLAFCSLKYGLNIARPVLLSFALPTKRIDEDFYTLSPFSTTICSTEKLLGPPIYLLCVGRPGLETEDGWSEAGFGEAVGVVYEELGAG